MWSGICDVLIHSSYSIKTQHMIGMIFLFVGMCIYRNPSNMCRIIAKKPTHWKGRIDCSNSYFIGSTCEWNKWIIEIHMMGIREKAFGTPIVPSWEKKGNVCAEWMWIWLFSDDDLGLLQIIWIKYHAHLEVHQWTGSNAADEYICTSTQLYCSSDDAIIQNSAWNWTQWYVWLWILSKMPFLICNMTC